MYIIVVVDYLDQGQMEHNVMNLGLCACQGTFSTAEKVSPIANAPGCLSGSWTSFIASSSRVRLGRNKAQKTLACELIAKMFSV